MDYLSKARAELAGKRRSDVEAFADAVGIKRGTMRHLIRGDTKFGSVPTIRKLEAYYMARDKQHAQDCAGRLVQLSTE